ncbi:unnamed protein product [Urochloa humidicola]
MQRPHRRRRRTPSMPPLLPDPASPHKICAVVDLPSSSGVHPPPPPPPSMLLLHHPPPPCLYPLPRPLSPLPASSPASASTMRRLALRLALLLLLALTVRVAGLASRVLPAGGAQGPWPAPGFDGLRDDEPLIQLDRSQRCPHPRRHRRLPHAVLDMQLYEKALDVFEDDTAISGILHKHLLRSMGTPIVDKVLITLAAASVLVHEKRKTGNGQVQGRD